MKSNRCLPLIFGALIPITVNAQTRGGTCQSDIYEFTGGLIGLALLVIILLSLSASIAKHSFGKGFLSIQQCVF